MFVCKICNKDFKQSSNLKAHENKKNRCGNNNIKPENSVNKPEFSVNKPENSVRNKNVNIDIDEIINNNNDKKYSCNFCYKNYTRIDTKNKHELSCHQKDRTQNAINDYGKLKNKYDKLLLDNKELQFNYDKLLLNNKELQFNYDKLINDNLLKNKKKTKKNIIDGNNNIINNNTINNKITNDNKVINKTVNININSLGNENVDHLLNDPNKLKQYIDNVFENDNIFLGSMEMINFDPNYPENHNIRYKNIRSNDVDIYDDDKWKVKDLNTISNSLLLCNRNYLNNLILKNNDISQKIKDGILIELVKYDINKISGDDIERVIEKYDYDGEVNMKDKYVKNIKNDIKKMLYNKTNELKINAKKIK